jgi:acyl-CoA thioester hydrolase
MIHSAFGRPPAAKRNAYRWFQCLTTRWMDNDAYGHVNNVVYYSWIDTAVNHFLLQHTGLDIVASPVIGIVAETGCRYRSPIAFPDTVTVGLRVARLGRSSVRYELGIFRNEIETAAAEGDFVHVYVDRASMRPVAIPDDVRDGLQSVATPEVMAAEAAPSLTQD